MKRPMKKHVFTDLKATVCTECHEGKFLRGNKQSTSDETVYCPECGHETERFKQVQ